MKLPQYQSLEFKPSANSELFYFKNQPTLDLTVDQALH